MTCFFNRPNYCTSIPNLAARTKLHFLQDVGNTYYTQAHAHTHQKTNQGGINLKRGVKQGHEPLVLQTLRVTCADLRFIRLFDESSLRFETTKVLQRKF